MRHWGLKPLVATFCYHPLVIIPPEGASAHQSARNPLLLPTGSSYRYLPSPLVTTPPEGASAHQSVRKPLISPFRYHPHIVIRPEDASAHQSVRKPLVSPTRTSTRYVLVIIPCIPPEGESAHQFVRKPLLVSHTYLVQVPGILYHPP